MRIRGGVLLCMSCELKSTLFLDFNRFWNWTQHERQGDHSHVEGKNGLDIYAVLCFGKMFDK